MTIDICPNDDTELIIDTLAVTFILDIDAAVYKLCVSDWLKHAAARIPHLELMIRIDHVMAEASTKITSMADAARGVGAKIRRRSDEKGDEKGDAEKSETSPQRGGRSPSRRSNPLRNAVSRWRLRRVGGSPRLSSRTRSKPIDMAHRFRNQEVLSNIMRRAAGAHDILVEFAIDQLVGILLVALVAFAVDWKICDETLSR